MTESVAAFKVVETIPSR